ncbi:carbonic anhydrase [Listeria sp. PSOL-1]|uniref:carbonic anhydrase n=1 Tax=Listeria sp. PSOL-1 TaxID=1844999 RepID=UPI0013D670F5|nr:carbonic anhydrase family protein [Listeria sp. PSOL-1]
MKKTGLIAASLMATSLLFAGCSNNTDVKEDKKKETKKEEVDYSKQDKWDFESGKTQSPINIDTNKTEKMTDEGKITLDYNDIPIDEVDNGHSIQVDDTGKAKIDGRQFELKQFHFHAKSEHTIDGKHFPIEAHFVNQEQDGRIAVIGVFFKEGKENAGFQEVLNNIKKGKKANVSGKIDVEQMLPANKTYYHYLGSLTTPPLSENVEWYLMKTPIEVSSEQIATFNKYYDGNNRKIQPLNGRKVLEHQE